MGRRIVSDSATAVYRLYGPGDELLYVGISEHPIRRWLQHQKSQPWFNEVMLLRIDWEPNRQAALSVESHIIRTQHPKYNDVHNGVIYTPPRLREFRSDAGEAKVDVATKRVQSERRVVLTRTAEALADQAFEPGLSPGATRVLEALRTEPDHWMRRTRLSKLLADDGTGALPLSTRVIQKATKELREAGLVQARGSQARGYEFRALPAESNPHDPLDGLGDETYAEPF